MALVNCTIDKRSVLLAKGSAVGSSSTVTLEIKPVTGHVVAASDFTNNTTIASPIQSITLSDSGTAYDVNNEVNVVVTLESGFTPTVDQTLVIDIDGEATRIDLIPITVTGEFTGNVLTDATSTASNVRVDDSNLDGNYNLIDNPFETHIFATLTVAASAGSFFETEPTIQVSNASYTGVDLEDQYTFKYVDTFDSNGYHTQRVYTCSITMPQVARTDDNISITATALEIPSTTDFIRGYQMNTTSAPKVGLNRGLAVLGDPGARFRVRIERGTLSGSTFTPDGTDRYYIWTTSGADVANQYAASTQGSDIFTIGDNGISRVQVLLPAETTDGISYQFNIVPQGTTTVKNTALGYVSSTLMLFYVGRLKDVKWEVDAVSSDSTITQTVVYKNYLDQVMSTAPSGLSNSEKGTTTAKYGFEISIDSDKDFYMNDESGNDVLSLDLDSGGVHTATQDSLLLGGSSPSVTGTNIVDPFELEEGDVNVTIGGTATQTVVDFTQATILGASAETNELGVTNGRAVGYTTQSAATGAVSGISSPGATTGNEIAIDLTLQEREALTNSSFIRLSDQEFKIAGRKGYFVISYYSANVLRKGINNLQTIPVAKVAVVLVGRSRKFLPLDLSGNISTQTLLVFPGRGYISNSTGSTPSSAIDRKKMLIKGTGFYVQNYGNLDAKYTFNIDNFSQVVSAGASAPTVTASLTHAVPKFIAKQYTNSTGTLIYFTGTVNYPNGTSGDLQYEVQNLVINAGHGLPVSYNASSLTTSSITGTIDTAYSSSEFNNATVTCTSTGSKTMANASSSSRTLTIGSSGSPLVFKVNSGSYTALSASHTLRVNITLQLTNNLAPPSGPPPSGGSGTGIEIAYE